jgi:ketosteroid isomerase-like protein
MRRWTILITALLLVVTSAWPAHAGGEDDIRAAFQRFVAGQNAHDVATIKDLLLDSPSFLWITRGAPIWGRDAAMTRFEALYTGTWRLEPEGELRVVMLSDAVAQLFVPIMFTIGSAGSSPQQTRFLMNQTLVKTAAGWKVASILPIASPAQ